MEESFINININSLKRKKIFKSLIILSFLFISFISVCLLLKNNTLYNGSDTQFNFKRIIELKESILHGHLFPNISLNEFHGSIVMSLYPYLNLFPAVLLSFAFKSKFIYIYLFFMLNTLLTLLISFYSSKSYTLSYSTSYVFSIIYGLSNLLLNYSIKGNDFGIVFTYILFPLIFFSFLNIINGKNNWVQLAIGMSLLLYSHILDLFIIGLFLLIMAIINIRNINKYIVKNIFKSIILFIMLTSVIWIPFLNDYFINFSNINMPIIKQLNNSSITNFFKGIIGANTNNTIGFFPTISILISLLFYKKFDKYVKQIYLISIIIVISVLFLPWQSITSFGIFKFLNQIQYTWRFLIIPQMTLAFIFSLIITKYIKNKKYKNMLIVLSILFAIIIQMIIGQYITIKLYANNPTINYVPKEKNKLIDISNYYNYRINNSYQFNLFINSYHNEDNDYIPKSALPILKYVNRNLGFYNDYSQIKVKHIGYNTFYFYGNNMKKLSLPIYAYNKEKLHVYLNNKPVDNYVNKDGLLTINNIKNNVKSYNKIYIKPVLNPFRIIGAILSIFGWLFALGVVIKRKFIH